MKKLISIKLFILVVAQLLSCSHETENNKKSTDNQNPPNSNVTVNKDDNNQLKDINLSELSDEQILKLIDSVPALKSEIQKEYNRRVKNKADSLVINSPLPKEITDEVFKITNRGITKENSTLIIKLCDSYLMKINNVVSSLKSEGKAIPKQFYNVEKSLIAKKNEAEKISYSQK